ncbi:MAG: hypothetical protein AAB389_01220 [Patescibacteria group bacterium]
MKKNLILLLVVAALIALGAWYWSSAQKGALPEDSTAAISLDLDGVDLGNLEGEFADVEAALGTL